MYINVTVDLENYERAPIELRLSNQHSVKSLIDITWQTVKLTIPPREGFWIKVMNKNKTFSGTTSLEESGITTGDRLKIL